MFSGRDIAGPIFLLPFYRICECLPATRDAAQRLGLVSLSQMINALIWSVENPPNEIRILDVPQIRRLDAVKIGN